MKPCQLVVSAGCLLAAVLSLSYASPTWRPQGRFGKRLTSLSSQDAGLQPDFGISHLQDVPVEVLYPLQQLHRSRVVHHLCSTTGLPGYPVCGTSTSLLSEEEAPSLESLLEL